MNHKEQDARQAELERLYEADGRHERSHPMHSLYTGLVAGATTEQESTDGAEQSSATAPAPAADRPLWEVMEQAYAHAILNHPDTPSRYAAEIDAVADWLAARKPVHGGAVVALRVQARRAREGQ